MRMSSSRTLRIEIITRYNNAATYPHRRQCSVRLSCAASKVHDAPIDQLSCTIARSNGLRIMQGPKQSELSVYCRAFEATKAAAFVKFSAGRGTLDEWKRRCGLNGTVRLEQSAESHSASRLTVNDNDRAKEMLQRQFLLRKAVVVYPPLRIFSGPDDAARIR